MRLLYESEAALKTDSAFVAAIRTWSASSKLCNMHIERCLSLFKQSTGIDQPVVERFAACGLMAQVLRDHLAAGGMDPRGAARAGDLVQAGVPLSRAGAARRKSQPSKARGLFRYLALHATPGLSAAARAREKARLSVEFRSLPAEERLAYQTQERQNVEQATALVGDDSQRKNSKYLDAIGSDLWDMSSRSKPVEVAHVSNVLDQWAQGCGVGMRNYVEPLRALMRKKVVVTDSGAINGTAHSRVPCGIAHPGLCPIKTPLIFQNGLRLVSNLTALVSQESFGVGTFIRLQSQPAAHAQEVFCCVASIRSASPPVALFVEARREGLTLVLIASHDESFLQPPMMASQLVARLLSSDAVVSVLAQECHVKRLPADFRRVSLEHFGEEVELLACEDVRTKPRKGTIAQGQESSIESVFKRLGRTPPSSQPQARRRPDRAQRAEPADLPEPEACWPGDSGSEGELEGGGEVSESSSSSSDDEVPAATAADVAGAGKASDAAPAPLGDAAAPIASDPPPLEVVEAVAEAPTVAAEALAAEVLAAPVAPAGAVDGGRNQSWPVTDAAGVVIGKIVWNAAGSSLDGHCCHPGHRDSHLGCRVNRTVRPGPKGKGRPLAFLMAWLRSADNHGGRDSHFQARLGRGEHSEAVSFENRLAAREMILADPSWAAAAAFERAPAPGEGPEPSSLP